MRAWGALLCALCLFCAFPAPADDDVPIQRYLENLQLGDIMKEIKLVYPPLREWPSYREPGGSVTRIYIERSYAKYFPGDVETLSLGLRLARLVDIQAVFDERHSREKPLEQLAVELSLIYGEPRRKGMTYYWRDSRTTLRVFNTEVQSPDGKAVELRATMEILDRGWFGGDRLP